MRPVLLLAETRVGPGASLGDDAARAPARLRPLPVWCPLPRTPRQPKATVVGWVAGTAAIAEEARATTSFACVVSSSPARIESNPRAALSVSAVRSGEGRLFPVGSLRSAVETVPLLFASQRTFRDGLDLGALNDRRHGAAASNGSGPRPLPGGPCFGRLALAVSADGGPMTASERKLDGAADPYIVVEGEIDEREFGAAIEALETITVRRWLLSVGRWLERRAREGGELPPAAAPFAARLARAWDHRPSDLGAAGELRGRWEESLGIASTWRTLETKLALL